MIILYYLLNISLKFHKDPSFRCGDICKTILSFKNHQFSMYCQAQPQLKSISIQFRLRLALFPLWSSHPPTQPPIRNRRYNSSQIQGCFSNTKQLLSDNLKITSRLLQSNLNISDDFKTKLRLTKDSSKKYFKSISMIKKKTT